MPPITLVFIGKLKEILLNIPNLMQPLTSLKPLAEFNRTSSALWPRSGVVLLFLSRMLVKTQTMTPETFKELRHCGVSLRILIEKRTVCVIQYIMICTLFSEAKH